MKYVWGIIVLDLCSIIIINIIIIIIIINTILLSLLLLLLLLCFPSGPSNLTPMVSS